MPKPAGATLSSQLDPMADTQGLRPEIPFRTSVQRAAASKRLAVGSGRARRHGAVLPIASPQPDRPPLRQPAAHQAGDRLSGSCPTGPLLTKGILLGAAEERKAGQVNVTKAEVLNCPLHSLPWRKHEQGHAGENEQHEDGREEFTHHRFPARVSQHRYRHVRTAAIGQGEWLASPMADLAIGREQSGRSGPARPTIGQSNRLNRFSETDAHSGWRLLCSTLSA